MSKPLAKSLHTVSVLVAVAQALKASAAAFAPVPAAGGSAAAWVESAAEVLGYAGAEDPYGLKAAAVRKLEKGA